MDSNQGESNVLNISAYIFLNLVLLIHRTTICFARICRLTAQNDYEFPQLYLPGRFLLV